MTERTGQWTSVDGESFANGKVRDVTITYEYDEIFDAILEYLMTEYEIGERGIEVELDDELTFDLNEFITDAQLEQYDELLGTLLDDDFGDKVHEVITTQFIEEYLDDDAELEVEGQEFR